MARVEFRSVWLNLAEDPAERLYLPFMASFSRKPSQEGNVRRLAGGRLRAIRRRGRADEWTLTLPNTTPAQKDWLERWIGEPVYVRDDRGHIVVGVYFGVPTNEHNYNHDGDVSLTIREITWDPEAVD